jgi:hypothetical protein
MAGAEERIRVLEMIRNGQITAEEGARLLEALRAEGSPKPERDGPYDREKGPTQLHIRVTDLKTGRQKIDMRMPWSLVSVGIDMGARFARKEIETRDFIEAIQGGAKGKIIDVVDEEDSERVEIFAE